MTFLKRICIYFLFTVLSTTVSEINAQLVESKVSYTLADTALAKKLIVEAEFGAAFQNNEESLAKALRAKVIYESALGTETFEVGGCWTCIGAAYFQMGRLPEAKTAWDLSLKIMIAAKGEESLATGICYANLGSYFRETGDLDNALIYTEKGMALQSKLLPPAHILLAGSYNNLGVVYGSKGYYDQALENFQKSLQIFLKPRYVNYAQVAQIYTNMGGMSQFKGDYDLALEYYAKGYDLFVKRVGENHIHLATPLNNMAIAYQSKGEYDRTITLLEKVLALRQKAFDEIHPDIAQSYVNLANSWFYKNEPHRAIDYFEKALGIYERMPSVQPADIASAQNNYGLTLHLLGAYSEAMGHHKKALDLYLTSVGPKHPNTASAWYHLGQCYQQLGEYEKADEVITQSLQALNYVAGDSFNRVNSMPFLTKCLSNMASLQRRWFVTGHCSQCLTRSYQYSHQAIAAVSYQSAILSPASKSILTAEAKEIYAGAMMTNYLLHILTDSLPFVTEAFGFAEHSKAMLILAALKESKALKFANIPDPLLLQERNLRIEIAHEDKRRQDKLAAGLMNTDSTLAAIGSKLFDLNRQYDTIKQLFEKDYPKYFKAKYDLSTVSLQEVQHRLLQHDQSLVEYLVGDSALYVFVIRKDTLVVREILRDFPLDQWVNDLTKDGIYGYYSLPDGHPDKTTARQKACDENYTQAALQLYQKLVAPVDSFLTERVIVIPDGVLGYVPFEALLVKEPGRRGAFNSYPGNYWIDRRQVSYCYSATLLREMNDRSNKAVPTKSVLAMSPFFRGDTTTARLFAELETADLAANALRDSLTPLKASGAEIAAITKLWNGTPFYGKDASIEKFLELAKNYRILHLSTHGKADDRQGDYAFLAFSTASDTTFSKLYARDLYNYSLNADLVVLSACETGIGELKRGEGIISLSRAFAYAGAKSIFTTLWKVSDKRTIDLTVPFYKYLKKGWPKDKALRRAKLDYLKHHKGTGAAVHPFFWAGMVGIGDMSAIP